MERTNSEIANFFDGESVFITGATGFLGKALMEKLLRCCSGVKTIFVLVRSKRGCEGHLRLKQLFNEKLFEVLKCKYPDALSKVIPICGDITEPNLGINAEDRQKLCQQVSVIIHSAATVKFDEPLKKSVKINVEGTKQIIDLAKESKNIKAVVHVSTAYSNCDRTEIEEMVYPVNIDPNHAVESFDWISEGCVEAITHKLLGGKPNTYTYTKHLAEQLVYQARDEVPICIVRPSIVAASYEEPFPGWIDNINGASGIFAACGKGYLQSLLCHTDKKLDVIPLDNVVSLIVAAAWRTAQTRGSNNSTVYNCCSGEENPFYLSRTIPWAMDAIWNTPFNNVVWFPGPLMTTSPWVNTILDFCFHFIPAHCLDLKARFYGEKATFVSTYHRVQTNVQALRYFCTTEFNFHTENTVNLYKMLPLADKASFKFDIKGVDWEKYMHNYIYGLRKYLLKEDDEDIGRAKVHLLKMYKIRQGFRVSSIVLLLFITVFVAILLQRLMTFSWNYGNWNFTGYGGVVTEGENPLMSLFISTISPCI